MNETEDTGQTEAGGQVDQAAVQEVTVENKIARLVSAEGDMRFTNSLAGQINVGGDVSFVDGAAGVLVAGRDITLTDGAGLTMVAGGNAIFDRAQVNVAVVGQDVRVDRSVIGLIVGHGNGEVLGDNNRLVLNRPLAILFGAAFGSALALTTWLLWRKKD